MDDLIGAILEAVVTVLDGLIEDESVPKKNRLIIAGIMVLVFGGVSGLFLYFSRNNVFLTICSALFALLVVIAAVHWFKLILVGKKK